MVAQYSICKHTVINDGHITDIFQLVSSLWIMWTLLLQTLSHTDVQLHWIMPNHYYFSFWDRVSCILSWTQTCYVSQGETRTVLVILLPPSLECWDYRHVPTCQARTSVASNDSHVVYRYICRENIHIYLKLKSNLCVCLCVSECACLRALKSCMCSKTMLEGAAAEHWQKEMESVAIYFSLLVRAQSWA